MLLSAGLALAALLSACLANRKEGTGTEKGYVSLMQDRFFKRGFNVWGLGLPVYGDEIELYGGDYEKQTSVNFDYDIAQAEKPVWKLQQWATRYPFHDKENAADPFDYRFTVAGDGEYLYENRSKTVAVNTNTSEFRLALKASECYKRPREEFQEWPHLLLSQDFGTAAEPTRQMIVSNARSLKVKLDMKMNSFVDHMGESADPALHAAICMLYLFVQYQPEGSNGYKDMIWLGMSLFDNRVAYPEGMSRIDGGKASASGKWIYNIDTRHFLNPENNIYDAEGNIQYDKWVTVDFEILPFIDQALKEAQAGGCMQGATWADLQISGMYIGFELPGTYDIDMSFRNLDIAARPTRVSRRARGR